MSNHPVDMVTMIDPHSTSSPRTSSQPPFRNASTETQEKLLLKILAKQRPHTLLLLGPGYNWPVPKYKVIQEMEIEFWQDPASGDDMGWLERAKERGLVTQQGDIWTPTALWGSQTEHAIQRKLWTWSSEYAAVCRLNGLAQDGNGQEGLSTEDQVNIEEAHRWFFKYRAIVNAAHRMMDEEGWNGEAVPDSAPVALNTRGTRSSTGKAKRKAIDGSDHPETLAEASSGGPDPTPVEPIRKHSHRKRNQASYTSTASLESPPPQTPIPVLRFTSQRHEGGNPDSSKSQAHVIEKEKEDHEPGVTIVLSPLDTPVDEEEPKDVPLSHYPLHVVLRATRFTHLPSTWLTSEGLKQYHALQDPAAQRAILDRRRLHLFLFAYSTIAQDPDCLSILDNVQIFCDCVFEDYQRLHACIEGLGGTFHTVPGFKRRVETTNFIRLVASDDDAHADQDEVMKPMTILGFMEGVNDRYDYALAKQRR